MAELARDRHFLDGQFLIAMPQMQDSRFSRSVIFVCAHSGDGAMGIVVNKLAQEIAFSELLVQLDIVKDAGAGDVIAGDRAIRVHRGGPVETARGFVLHSADFGIESATLSIRDGISLTATLEILRAIAEGGGPDKAFLALGYAGWAPGQLESEIHANGWLTCAADADILFDAELDTKYDRALAKIGVDPRMLSMSAGHA